MSVILVEGLPGSGKSTTAHLLARQLERAGRKARWIYEHETPHPILQYADVLAAIESGRAQPGMFDEAVAHWRAFAAAVPSGDAAVFESAFFQIPVHPMLLLDWERERIHRYVSDVEVSLGTHNPVLVFLRHEDVAAALTAAAALRGEWFAGFLVERVSGSPYGTARGLRGMEGVIAYFTAFRDLLDELASRLSMRVLVLDASGDKSTFTARVLEEIGVPASAEPTIANGLRALTGHYHAVGADEVFRVAFDGAHLFLEGDAPARLLPVAPGIFDICGTPVRLTFVTRGLDGPNRLLCEGRLPNLPREWERRS